MRAAIPSGADLAIVAKPDHNGSLFEKLDSGLQRTAVKLG